jgi:hydroxymethylpyrimidine/phosphomethylpyrimidine kinase
MLATASTVSLVAESLRRHNITKSVVDPVSLSLPRRIAERLTYLDTNR